MSSELGPDALAALTQATSIASLPTARLVELLRADEQVSAHAPDGRFQVDPRDGAVILYSSARARRPHAYVPPPAAPPTSADCPICAGQTTGALDVAPLSAGFTFINQNLYPILQPSPATVTPTRPLAQPPGPAGDAVHGLHLVQWTSTRHDWDWHNLPRADRVVVMQRLAALERRLLFDTEAPPPPDAPPRGYVVIIKNAGAPVGGSLPHGHQQIAYSSVMPRRFQDNLRFLEQRGEPFAAYLLRANPPELLVKDYGSALLLVPYCMRRPYSMLLLVKDWRKRYLAELADGEIMALADGWHDAIRAMLSLMPAIGKEPAYNVTVNNGPGAGLYVEFLPYTQETGGFEQLGLWVCQNTPQRAAAHLRQALA